MPSQPATPTHLIKFEVERFLATANPEILCIRGYWGVGKTYFWNELLRSSERAEKISLTQYSYVSLFGVQTVDELKLAIFENTVEIANVGKEPSLETFAENMNAAFEPLARKLVSRVTEALPGFKNLTGTIHSLSFLSVTDRIICIDDIERKGEKLRIIDILGLMQLLRDRRNCKIVLILNDHELEKSDQDALARYHEKSIDHSLVFAPSPAESCEIALPKQDVFSAYLAQRCVKLEVTNIRVIQRLGRLLEQIQPLLAAYHVDVQRQAVSTLALLGSLHFSRTSEDEDAFLDFAINRQGSIVYDSDEQLSEEEKAWARKLHLYGYLSTDELDLALLDGIRVGYFDPTRLKELVARLDTLSHDRQANEALEAAWGQFLSSFDDDEEMVATMLVRSIEENLRAVSLTHLDTMVRFLRDLKRDVQADALISFFIENKDAPPRFFNLKKFSFAHRVKDSLFRAALETKTDETPSPRKPRDILEDISTSASWSAEDLALLGSLTADDYYALFQESRGDTLKHVVDGAVEIIRMGEGAQGSYASAIAGIEGAFSRLESESSINALRVSHFRRQQ